ncbi:conserved protein of unknown function [Tenacibaculum sp. 190130A14a]|uniref:Membrane or secreted protein n=1 Tax=Tenacibaculum polynesiense TaxID=3137857 RepID=A0ABM9PAI3_9FLAO
MSKKQKYIVLFALFIVPLLFYIFLQLGTHNFGKLPIVTKDVLDVSLLEKKHTFKGKVSVVVFAGNDVALAEGELFNLNEKVYKKFYGYTDFQMICLVTKEQEEAVDKFIKKVSINTNLVKWNFVFASKEELNAIYDSFKTGEQLDANAHVTKAYIVDKENNLRRGKTTIKTNKAPSTFGYNMKSVAELKNDMHDDVKVVLAEYSFALKKNRSEDRRKLNISNEKK